MTSTIFRNEIHEAQNYKQEMKVRQRKSAEKVYKDCEGKKDIKGKMGIVSKNTVIKKAFLKWKNEKTANTKYILYL